MQDILGGSSGSSSQSSQSGWGLLPPEIQNAFTSFATTAGNTLNPGGTPNSSMFTNPALSTGATDALGQIQNQDFAITPDKFNANMSMLQNPYNQSVINQIERAQNGQNSQLTSEMSNAGDFGSNRGMLGASDISNAAADQIGSFLSNQYDANKTDALTTIPQNQAQSAQGAVNAGLTAQQQQITNNQAPATALAALAKLYGILPTSGGSTSTGSSSNSSSPGLAGLFSGGSNSGAAGAAALFAAL